MRFRLVAMDETVYYQTIDGLTAPIWGLYYYTDEERTHLCEMQPSFACFYIGSEASGVAEDDEAREEIAAKLVDANLWNPLVTYWHCSYIASLPEERFGPWKDFESEDDALEWFQGNLNCPPCVK